MENEKPSRTPNFEKRVTGIIKDLMAANKSSLNRHLAIEAMMDAMLAQVPQAVLPALLEEYEAGCDRLAQRLPANMQEPDLWAHWSDAISARQEHPHTQHPKAD